MLLSLLPSLFSRLDNGISLGDSITDFLQGLFLIFDFDAGFSVKEDTWNTGVVVLTACWLPGLVAVPHFLSYYRLLENLVIPPFLNILFYRNEYFGLHNTPEKNNQKVTIRLNKVLLH